jgi:hypothetical protein
MRRCKQCRIEIPRAAKCTDFISKKGFCGIDCATEWGKNAAITKREREYRKSMVEAKERLKTRSDFANEAQAAVNAYVRLRDENKPCISCQRYHDGQYHAGHYRTRKAAPQHRFNVLQIRKQCSACNNHLSGNITEFRINLVKLISAERVEQIENDNEIRRYDIDYLKRIKAVFKKRTNHLRRLRQCKQSN